MCRPKSITSRALHIPITTVKGVHDVVGETRLRVELSALSVASIDLDIKTVGHLQQWRIDNSGAGGGRHNSGCHPQRSSSATSVCI